MSIAKQYTREIAQSLQYLPVWLPTRTLSLGDVGIIKDNVFEVQSTLEAMNVGFARSASRPTAALRYYSHDGVSISLKASGTAPAAGSALTTVAAGVVVKFSRAKAVVFEAGGCKIEAISDLAVLGNHLVGLYQRGSWSENLYVVTEVVTADVATILISSGAGASVELTTSGDLGSGGLSLANLDAQFGIASMTGMGFEIVGQTGLTPLFKAWRVNPGFWNVKWEKYGMERDEQAEGEPDVMPVFSPMSIGDLWPE
jgi:hypothetical protein